MARNLPHFEFKMTSGDDSDIANSLDTTNTPDSLRINETENGFENLVGFSDRRSEFNRGQHIGISDFYAAFMNGRNISRVVVFDMRGKIKQSVEGEGTFMEHNEGVLKQRLASMKGVSEDQLLFINNSENTIRATRYVAILDNTCVQNLTVFYNSGPFIYRCITLPRDSDVQLLLDKINLSPPIWPFCKGKRLEETSSLFDQGVICGDNINLFKIRTENVKCLFQAAPKYEQLFTVECLSIDSICELKLKIRETLRNLNRTFNTIPKSVLNSYIWLTSGKRIYLDKEYICLLEFDLDSRSDSNDSMVNTYYDYILHFEPQDYIPVSVSYRVDDARFSKVETVIVPRQSSTTHLCECISKLLSCLPTAVKLIIQGKKIPMTDDLSTFTEFKPSCEVHASVKRAITVNVTLGDKSLNFQVMKMDKVESLKCKIADKIKKLPRVLRLEFNGKELVDWHRIEQQDIKDNCTVNAKIVEDRIQISIRKRSHPITHLIVENLAETMIRDLKNYYRHAVSLSSKLDIDLYSYKKCSQLDDFATLKAVETKDKDVFFAIEKILSKDLVIFEAQHNGSAEIKYAIIHNGVIYYSSIDPRTITKDNQEDHAYSLPSTCCNIRLAQAFEVESFEYSLSPEPLLYVHTPLAIKPYYGPVRPQQQTNMSLTLIQTSIVRPFSDMSVSSTNTVMNRTTDGSNLTLGRDSPEVIISDTDLQKLANELPGNNWQSFIRGLGVPNANVVRHTEAYPKNVVEAIYQCLNDWKQHKGNEAKICTIQKHLHEHGLLALSTQLFGYNTV